MPGKADQRQLVASRARDHLARAGAALTEWWTGDNLAFALMETGLALHEIARLDGDRRAYTTVTNALHAMQGTSIHPRRRENPDAREG